MRQVPVTHMRITGIPSERYRALARRLIDLNDVSAKGRMDGDTGTVELTIQEGSNALEVISDVLDGCGCEFRMKVGSEERELG